MAVADCPDPDLILIRDRRKVFKALNKRNACLVDLSQLLFPPACE
jgi:hypothetical protein